VVERPTAVVPRAMVLKAEGVAATVGRVPVGSVAAQTPMSGMDLAVVA